MNKNQRDTFQQEKTETLKVVDHETEDVSTKRTMVDVFKNIGSSIVSVNPMSMITTILKSLNDIYERSCEEIRENLKNKKIEESIEAYKKMMGKHKNHSYISPYGSINGHEQSVYIYVDHRYKHDHIKSL